MTTIILIGCVVVPYYFWSKAEERRYQKELGHTFEREKELEKWE